MDATMARFRDGVLPFGLSLTLLALAGCGEKPDNTRWEETQNRTTGGGGTAVEDDLSDDADDFPEVWGESETDADADDGDVANASDLPGQALDASKFNRFFPEQFGDYDMVPKQEKGATAIWDLERDETVLCQFSVTDLAANPRALEKYRDADRRIADYPAVTQGSKTTALLVAGRLQVKASSRDDSFNATDRETWLKKFDLAGLAATVDSE